MRPRASPCYLNIIDPADVALGEGSVNDIARVAADLLDGGFLSSIGECLAAPTEERRPVPPIRGLSFVIGWVLGFAALATRRQTHPQRQAHLQQKGGAGCN